MIIIDGHSHIGTDYHTGNSSCEDYENYINTLNVDYGLVMPFPNPMNMCNGTLVRPNLNNNNPYKIVNSSLFFETCKYDNLFFIPLLHPLNDTKSYLEWYYNNYHPIAFKIHGIGSRTCAGQMSGEVIEFLREKNIPLIIHSDYVKEENNTRLKDLRIGNMALLWAKFLIDNNLKGTINHAASFDKKVFELVNNNNNIMIALGPDLILKNNDNRLVNNIEGEFLIDVQKYLDVNKMIFVFDYNCNIINGVDDLNVICRFREAFSSKNFEKIIGGNAAEFYNIKKRVLERK